MVVVGGDATRLSTVCGCNSRCPDGAVAAVCCERDISRHPQAVYEHAHSAAGPSGSAACAAEFRAQARRAGRTVDVGDALIAGTAKAHDLAIATRNIRDFQGMGIDIVNPWDSP